MYKTTVPAIALAVAGVTLWVWDGHTSRAPAATTQPAAADAAQTQAVVDATTAFLATLTADQRAKVQFPFVPQRAATAAQFKRTGMGGRPGGGGPGGGNGPGGRGRPGDHGGPGGGGPDRHGGPGGGPMGGFVGEQYGKAVWSNFPVSDVPRPGLRLGTLTAPQRDAAMHLLQVLLSPKGYQKVLDIMGADQVLHDDGEPFDSGRDAYTLGLFGTPSVTTPWMIQFGGHHLGLNVTMAGGHGTVTPTMTGAQPAQYSGSDGKTVRPMGAENDKAFALLDALEAGQRKQAILNYEIGDLVMGPGHDGEVTQPEGVRVSSMNGHQRDLLMDVISEWAGIVNDRFAAERTAEIRAGLDDTYFAWSGPTTHEPNRNGSAYYRIQGPKVVIEFSPQGVGGDLTNHVHTVYRDPTNEYGKAYTTTAPTK